MRRDFNAQQVRHGSKERMVASTCTEVTATLDDELKGPLPRGYRYFGCRIQFNRDGGATAVMAWRRAATFEDGVTIERIQWDDDRKPGMASDGNAVNQETP